MPVYDIQKINVHPKIDVDFTEYPWSEANELQINNFRPESSETRPETRVRVLYNQDAIFGIFNVKDKFVRCIHTSFQDSVCKDSCVEFFVQPAESKGYFNFEFNCGGALLCSYITDCTRTENGFKSYVRLTEDDAKDIKIYHTLPQKVNPEIQEDTEWRIGFSIPFKLFEKYTGNTIIPDGQTWRANFYKCGDETSHPHWASWAPVSELNFHLPQCFGEIKFI